MKVPASALIFIQIPTLFSIMSLQSDISSRLAQLRARRQSGGTSNLLSGVFTPLRGGFIRPVTIQPIVYGEEIALIKDATALCLGRIGTGGNICLKLVSECDTETHDKKKGEVHGGKSLIVLKGNEKGYENVMMEADDLDQELIDELLNRQNVSWASEFAKMRSNDTKSIIQREVVEDTLNTARKHRTFASPAKHRATEDILDKIALLDTSQSLVDDILALTVNESGEGVGKDFAFSEEPYLKTCTDVYDKVEVLAENSRCLNDVILNLQPFIQSHTKPLENLLSGMRTEMASLHGQLGNKDLFNKDIPPCLWSAVESGYESVANLDHKVTKLTTVASEAHEIAETLLDAEENNLRLSDDQVSKVKFERRVEESDPASTRVVDGKIYRQGRSSKSGNGSGGGGGKRPPSDDGLWSSLGRGFPDGDDDHDDHGDFSDVNCDSNEVVCRRCNVKFAELENMFAATNTRVANLEDSKNGSVEAAIMIKNKIYRGRADIAAELDMWFPLNTGMKIDAGLFPTPHLILNLMHADMCSKRAPKIPLDQKDLIKLEIRRSDADAFYALQSDKPEFMTTNELCPNFSYKANKAQRDAATIRFLPSHEDFGNGLDSDSLHFKFKSSLDHVKGERERYIETRLCDHPDHRVLAVAKQLLEDAVKFIRQMLSFMEEIYSACYDSFGATSEAWELVTHCVEEVFTKELKPCLKHCVAQDLVDVKDALIGVVHTAFSLNCKLRELTSIGLKNHHSTTTSHVRFVMKMAKTSRKSETKGKAVQERSSSDTKLLSTISTLEKENNELKSHVKRVESRLDSFKAQVKSYLGVTEDELSKPKKKSSPKPKDGGERKE